MTCDRLLSTRASRKRVRYEDEEIFVNKRIIPSVSESFEKLSFQSDYGIQMPNAIIGRAESGKQDNVSFTTLSMTREEGPPSPLLRQKSKYVRQVDFLIDELIRNTRRKLQAAVTASSDVDVRIPNTVGPDPRTDHSISALWPMIPLKACSDSAAAMRSYLRPSASSCEFQRFYRDEEHKIIDSSRVSGYLTHADWFLSNCDDDFTNIDGSTASIGDGTCKVCREKGRRSFSDNSTSVSVSMNCSDCAAKGDHPGTCSRQPSPCNCGATGRIRRSISNASVSSDGNEEDALEEVLPDSPVTLSHSSDDDDDCGTIIE